MPFYPSLSTGCLPSLFLVSTLLLFTPISLVNARPIDHDQSCNICRDSLAGERKVVNSSKSFIQGSSGITTTCGELQASVRDLNPISGAPGEARLCVIAQYLAWLHCDCSGPDIPPPTDNYVDPNPACNLCAGRDFNFIPEPNLNKLSNTGCCGNMNCQILYQGAAEGVLKPHLCTIVQQNSGSDCCNLEAINTPPTSPTIQNRDRNICLGIQTSCSKVHGLRCCDGLECRDRSINGDSICSAVTKNSKTRLSDGGDSLGGSDRRSRKGVRGGKV
ncbi:hypothetical protein IV203_018369 [Nitzschia inconspicua]|uniref:Sodefrin-like factor n=1 Tax=Nitzschia inconspicua TaxID=303405 RepID=A0A9K3M537_9STRA|nr:hypothetical protein IV203_018369 [Nitzschia inconspicua]